MSMNPWAKCIACGEMCGHAEPSVVDAEVERLRADLLAWQKSAFNQASTLDACQEEVERLRPALAQSIGSVGRLLAENTELRGEVERLRAENALVKDQEVRTAKLCAELQTENEALNEAAINDASELEWFKRREGLARNAAGTAAGCDLAHGWAFFDWERDNPRPGSGGPR